MAKSKTRASDTADLLSLADRLERPIGPTPLAGLIRGTKGNDVLRGTAHTDTFSLTGGGHDKVIANAGNDIAVFGKTLEAKDRFDGGSGIDIARLGGNYSHLLVTHLMLRDVEVLDLRGHFTYSLKLSASLVPDDHVFTVRADGDGADKTLTLNGAALGELSDLKFVSGNGHGTFLGGEGNDLLVVHGAGSVVFDGNEGYNRVDLSLTGGGVTFDLGAAGAQTVGATALTVYNVADVTGTTGDDVITGTDADNVFSSMGGNDHLLGHGGNDLFVVAPGPAGATPPTGAVIEGGDGFDIVDFAGDGLATGGVHVVLPAAGSEVPSDTAQGTYTLIGIEGISGTPFDDDLGAASTGSWLFGGLGQDALYGSDGNDRLYGDAAWTVDSPNGTDGPQTIVDNDASTSSDFLFGGGGRDQLWGGGGNDYLSGGAGADEINPGSGTDAYYYTAASDSTPDAPDVIFGYELGEKINVSSVDADTGTPDTNDAFHFGTTDGHTGDIVVHGVDGQYVTVIDLYTDADATPDMSITLSGIYTGIDASCFVL